MPHFQSKSTIKDAIGLGLSALLIFFFLYFFVVRSFWIPSPSMVPTILPGDRLLADLISYRFREPVPGDVVVVKVPPNVAAESNVFIKRVIAVGGQEVQVYRGKLYVDGKVKDEPYVWGGRPTGDFAPFQVPRGTLFLMGDNRGNSKDSRFFGPLRQTDVIGRAWLTYWPPSRLGLVR